MNLRRFLFLTFIFLTFPAHAAIMELPVPLELIAFVEQKSGVALLAVQKIQIVDNGDPIFNNAEAHHAGASAAEKAGIIYLPVRSAVHFQEAEIEALIVHELTHVAQERSRKIYTCAGQKEAEAYENQILYLKEQGQFPYRPSQDEIDAMARCEDNS